MKGALSPRTPLAPLCPRPGAGCARGAGKTEVRTKLPYRWSDRASVASRNEVYTSPAPTAPPGVTPHLPSRTAHTGPACASPLSAAFAFANNLTIRGQTAGCLTTLRCTRSARDTHCRRPPSDVDRAQTVRGRSGHRRAPHAHKRTLSTHVSTWRRGEQATRAAIGTAISISTASVRRWIGEAARAARAAAIGARAGSVGVALHASKGGEVRGDVLRKLPRHRIGSDGMGWDGMRGDGMRGEARRGEARRGEER
jgi:hypothetical protein